MGLLLAANVPWLVAGFLHAGSARTAAAGAATFALQAEGRVPGPVAALSLGGIWNGDVVPDSRTGLAGWLTAVLVVGLAVLGHRTWRAAMDLRTRRAVAGCWVVGMGLALLTWAVPDAVGWLASRVPGGGVMRDGARMLVLAAPAVATRSVPGWLPSVGVVSPDRLAGRGRRPRAAAGPAARGRGLGGGWPADGRVLPRQLPEMRAAVAAGPPGDVLVLPLSSSDARVERVTHGARPRRAVPAARLRQQRRPRRRRGADPGRGSPRGPAAAALSCPPPPSAPKRWPHRGRDRGDRPDRPRPRASRRRAALTPAGADLTVVAVAGQPGRGPSRTLVRRLRGCLGPYVATAVLLPLLLAVRARRRRHGRRTDERRGGRVGAG